MRTIKFRGKVDDENEWVYGYLVLISNGDEHLSIYQPEPHDKSVNCGCGIFSVHKESIGQFTGFYDMNGKEIYEGDIVSFIDLENTPNGYFEHDCYGVVYFNEEKGHWAIGCDADEDLELYDIECGVISNIIDMPNWREECNIW